VFRSPDSRSLVNSWPDFLRRIDVWGEKRDMTTTAAEVYCDACHLAIGLQKHAICKKRRKGNPIEYVYYHNRDADDCWGKQLKALMRKYNGKAR
jgi:hypothetical protein